MSKIRYCSNAYSKIYTNNLFHKYFLGELGYLSTKINEKKFFSELSSLGEAIQNCQKELYSGKKGYGDNIIKNISDQNQPTFNNPREKAIFYISNFPHINIYIEMYKDLDMTQLEREENENFMFNKVFLDHILDNPKFIESINKYIWSCLYSYAINTMYVIPFVDYMIHIINERTRPNYIINKCDISKKATYFATADLSQINLYDYTCGRAISSNTKANKNTRIIIYNTIGYEEGEDYMDTEYYESIEAQLTGGKLKRLKDKKNNKLY